MKSPHIPNPTMLPKLAPQGLGEAKKNKKKDYVLVIKKEVEGEPKPTYNYNHTHFNPFLHFSFSFSIIFHHLNQLQTDLLEALYIYNTN